jgi:MFS family permease
LGDLTRDLALNQTQASMLFMVPSTFAIFGSVAAGSMAQSLGVVSALRFGAFLMVVGFSCLSLVNSLPGLIVFAAVFGFGLGVANVVQNLAISEATPEHLRRRFLNGLHAVYGVSAISAPSLALGVYSIGWGWREAFPIACIPLLGALVASFWVRGKVASRETEANAAPSWSTWRALKKTRLWSLTLGLYLWLELGLTTRIVIYGQQHLAMGVEKSNWVLLSFFAALLIGRLIFAIFPLRLSNSATLRVSLAGGAAFAFLGIGVSPWFFVLSGLAMAPFFPVFLDELSKTYRHNQHLAVSTVIGVSAVYIVMAHFLIGWIADLSNIQTALLVAPIGATLALFALGRAQRFGSA